jgi:myo-inositol-1(or 4)-monophosphatase
MSVDWPAVCRDAGAAVARVLEELPTRADREPVVGDGLGGDETTALDAAAEAAVVEVLERVHAGGAEFTLVSEELGERRFGDAADVWVVLDPIDGSLNAKRGIPFFCVSIAVADGPTMGDVFFGYVLDLGTGEEWTATRGRGAALDGRPLDAEGPTSEVEILELEATRTDLVAAEAPSLVGFAVRTRVMGALALGLCHLAAGRVDAVCSLKPARSVDIAAAQLLVRERGYAIDLPEDAPFERAALDVAGRSRVVAAATRERCEELFSRLSQPERRTGTSTS